MVCFKGKNNQSLYTQILLRNSSSISNQKLVLKSQRDRKEYNSKTRPMEFGTSVNIIKQYAQILLISKQSSSMSLASSFFNKTTELQKNYSIPKDKDKLKVKIDDLIKIFNANTKVDALSSNVMELQDIIKGNVNKLVNNMTQLDTAERKSSIMSQLSMKFQRDSKALQQKMKRRKCIMKMMIAGFISLVIGIVLYFLFA